MIAFVLSQTGSRVTTHEEEREALQAWGEVSGMGR